MTPPPLLAGVDGCTGGWIAVLARGGAFAQARVVMVAAFADILALPERPAVVAIDMPVGLPERSLGGRAAERSLRLVLGKRRSSVFSIPSRVAVHAENYGEARRLALATSEPPRSLSKQAFNIFPKIREIDVLLRGKPALAARVRECHPEGSFRMMRGAPLAFAKLKAEGARERRALLLEQGFAPALLDAKPPRGAKTDDVFDACAALWTAARIADGTATRHPEALEHDAQGLPMAIWT